MTQPWSPAARYFVLSLILILAGVAVWSLRELIGPLVTAGVIAYVFYPVVELLHRRVRISAKAAARIVFFFVLGMIFTLPVLVLPAISDELRDIGRDLLLVLDQIGLLLAEPVRLAGLELDLRGLVPEIQRSLARWSAPAPEEALVLLAQTSRDSLWLLVILVSTYYFMTDWEKVREFFLRLPPEEYQPDARRLYADIKLVWMAYLRGQLTLMTIVAVVFSIIWSIIGLPGAIVLGILAGMFSLIPDVGPFAATALALIVALLEGSTWMPISNLWFGVLVAGLYVVLINVKNIWLRPLILGRSVKMHEGVVFVAIVAAVVFTGILGAFIIVPALASLAVIGRYLRRRMIGLPPFGDGVAAALTPLPDPQPKIRENLLRKNRA